MKYQRSVLNVKRIQGFALVEILVAIGIIAVLLAILLPAIHKVRLAADRIRCSNQLRQLSVALIRHHDEHGALPMGVTPNEARYDFSYMTWLTRLLPYVEQNAIWQLAMTDYRSQRNPFFPTAHSNLAVPMPTFVCPSDPRGPGPHPTHRERQVGVSSFIGVLGTDHAANNGVLSRASSTRFTSVTDGTAFTLLVGERPPAADFWYGWWYAGVGMSGSGAPDSLLGVHEFRSSGQFTSQCANSVSSFMPGRLDNVCDVFHFWSLHPGGANFAMCDGSVHFLSYSADSILPTLATRACNEAVEWP